MRTDLYGGAAPLPAATPSPYQPAPAVGTVPVAGGIAAVPNAVKQGPVATGAAPLGAASGFTAYAPVQGPTGPTGNATGHTGTSGPTGPTGPTGPELTPLQIAEKIAADKAAADKAAALTSAANSLNSILSSYGLTGGIAAGVTAMLQNGLDIATIQTILDSPDPAGAIKGLGLTPTQFSAAQGLVTSWQTRFVGNQTRIAAGLNPLDPATYIANEQSYKQVMTMAGIPASSPLQSTAYLGQLMGTDVSPAEVQMRVNTATAAIQNEDPQVLAQLQSQYGLSLSTIATHLLDPTVAAPLVQQEYNAANIGAEAARAGTNIAFGATGPLSAMGLAAQGITQNQAAAGFQSIASQQPAMQSLAGRYQGYGNAGGVGQQLEASTFGTSGAAAAQANLERLKTQEVSAFSGSAGAATGSLGMKDISGLS